MSTKQSPERLSEDQSPIDGGHSPTDDTTGLTRAAISMPLLHTPGREPGIVLTRRPRTIDHHPGEICFPGGKIGPGDSSAFAAACRELDEELGVELARIRSYRPESGCATTSGYFIEAFAMEIDSAAEIRPDVREIDTYLVLPVARAMALEHYRIEKFSRSRDDFGYTFPTDIGPVRGATCALLLGLVKAIFRAGSFEAYTATFSTLHPSNQ